MHVWLSACWLVQMRDGVGGKDTHGYLLCDDCLAVPCAKVAVEWGVEAILIVSSCGGEGTVCVGGRGGDNGQSQHGYIVLFSQPDVC